MSILCCFILYVLAFGSHGRRRLGRSALNNPHFQPQNEHIYFFSISHILG